ncbi:hypothetical protein ACP70R_009983 [Stipagrostis hirtigluma subsp. patula]
MAPPAEDVEVLIEAASAAATEAKAEEERDEPGVLAMIWRALFGGRGQDYEKRLQYLSEEAAVHARMRLRTQFSSRAVRNLIVLSVLGEVGAVVYAFIMTRSKDLNWQMRAIRVLPVFLLPALSSMIYSVLITFTRLERKDQSALERLRAERKAKIDELEERTNYYLTQQLIQKYDLDPAAKAAAASVLASKLGAETGLKVYMGDETKSDSAQARSSDVEVVPPVGLQNRKQTKENGSSDGSTSTTAAHAEEEASNQPVGAGMEGMQPSKAVGHYQGSGTSDGGWIAKTAALICSDGVISIMGLARKEDFPHVTYYCPHCQALNMSNQSTGQCSSSDSGQLTPAAPADEVSTTTGLFGNWESFHLPPGTKMFGFKFPDSKQGTHASSVQELAKDENAGKQPVEPAH